MTTSDRKSYLSYLKELVNQYNNTYHRFIGLKLVDTNYSALTEDFKLSHKAPKFKVGDRVRIIKYKNIFSKGYIKNW